MVFETLLNKITTFSFILIHSPTYVIAYDHHRCHYQKKEEED